MKRLLIIPLLLISCSTFAQDRGEFWFAAGVKREVAKNLTASVGSNVRINYMGQLQTLYQEASIKSDHLSWLRPSLESGCHPARRNREKISIHPSWGVIGAGFAHWFHDAQEAADGRSLVDGQNRSVVVHRRGSGAG